jgi:hypothetical protein
MGNHSTVFAIGEGTIRILVPLGRQLLALDIKALFAPNLRMSLLSVGQLSVNHSITFVGTSCFVKRQDGSRVVLGNLRNGFWELVGNRNQLSTTNNTEMREPSALPAAGPNLTEYIPSPEKSRYDAITLWHQRLGHLNFKGVSALTGLSSKSVPLCHTCIQAKHKRSFERTPVERASRPFELNHSDLCGPISTPSWSGARYLIHYISTTTLAGRTDISYEERNQLRF